MGKREREGEEDRAAAPSSGHDKPRKEKNAKAKPKSAADAGQAPAAAPALAAAAAAEQAAELQPAAGSHDADAAAWPAQALQPRQEDGAAAAGGGGSGRRKGGKPAPVLPWMRVPIAIEASEGVLLEEVQGLDPRLKAALEGTGIEVLFPVQTVVWHQTAGGASAAHDVCICAPTGSGKTLAYALPVLQALAARAAPRLRALVVLPTRDLASQVFTVLSDLCPALGLTACLAAGKASLAAEAELLAGGGIDIVVATPGRLISHLEGTPGFTLAHLRFLVVDETDRLLRQDYQGWLPKVMAALAEGGGASSTPGGDAQVAGQPRAPSQAARRVVKFVVSATLTRDPSKIDRLDLHCPRYIAMSAVDHRYKLPPSLKEYKLVVPAERKPAALAALLQELRDEPTIVFASSVEATHRLHLVLAALPCLPGRAVEFSSLVPPGERGAHLEAFRSGEAKVLVCSDAMTRGMDVAGVANVINYDAPVYVKTYVHRAGRTARAGRPGRVFTLLRHEDVRHFRDMLRKADNTFVRDHRLAKGALEAVRDDVDDALERMADQLRLEQQQAQQQAAGGVPEAQPAASEAQPAAAAAAARQDGGKRKRRRLGGVPEFCLVQG